MTDTNFAAKTSARDRGARQGRYAKATGAAKKSRRPAISPLDPYSAMSEHQIQAALFRAYEKRGIGGSAVMFAIPNGGIRGDTTEDRKIRGKILKDEGVDSGVHDICAILEGAVYFIEIKRVDGKLSADQRDFHKRLEAAGGHGYTCYGYLEAVALLEDIGIIRRPIIKTKVSADENAEAN